MNWLKERMQYRIKPRIHFFIEKDYIFLLPTLLYVRWQYRYPGRQCAEIHWLVFVVSLGVWEVKDDAEI